MSIVYCTKFILLFGLNFKCLVIVDGYDGHVRVKHLPDLSLPCKIPGVVDRDDLNPLCGGQ